MKEVRSLVYAFRKVSIESTKNKHTTLRYRKFKNFNSDHFRNDICQQDWSNIENYSDPNLMWAAWKQLFLECVNKHAPLHVKRARASKSPSLRKQPSFFAPGPRTPLGPGAKKDGCFRRLQSHLGFHLT